MPILRQRALGHRVILLHLAVTLEDNKETPIYGRITICQAHIVAKISPGMPESLQHSHTLSFEDSVAIYRQN